MKPKLNLRQIEAFRAVMRTGTVVAAADMLCVSQPAISRLVSELELRLGFGLFERRGRRLVPTAQGEQLYREVERVYLGVERIAQAAVDIRHHRSGELRVACLPALSNGALPRAIKRFHDAHPGVYLFVNSASSRQICELVATGEFDVGVVELPVSDATVAVEAVPKQPVVLLVPATHPLAQRKRVALKALAGEPMILLSHHSPLRHALDRAFFEARVSPKVAFETPHSLLACHLAEAGLGIAVVPEQTAGPFAGDRCKMVPVHERLSLDYGLITPTVTAANPLGRAFVAAMRKEIVGG